ncbi:hypothetical protein AB1Y20_019627 [Prymnesium parvum]|uniref:SSD domain-containing protein n=1 Tax=Prymnesium parvum TaxID=97485 RepID=A0AB34JRI3_PRYPA
MAAKAPAHDPAVDEEAACDSGCLANKSQSTLQHGFHQLGKWIARNPRTAIGIGLFVLISGVPGSFLLPGEANLLWVKMAAGFEPFSLVTTAQYSDREDSNNLHNSYFVPLHGRNSQMIISPRDPLATPVFSHAFMTLALDLVLSVYSLQVSVGGVAYEFKDLCVPVGTRPFDSPVPSHVHCSSANNDLLSAIRWNASYVAAPGAAALQFGVGAHDYAGALAQLDASLSSIGINATGVFRSVVGLRQEPSASYHFWDPSSLLVPFTLRDTRRQEDGTLREPYDRWIHQLESHLKGGGYVHEDVLRVTFISDQSIGDGLQSLLDTFVPFLFLVFIIMAFYAEVFLFSQTRTKQGEATQILLVMQGLVVSGLAGFSGMGWILYLGLENIVILCCMAVFLVMAVGVDCTFIFISAMKAAGEHVNVEEAMGHMLSEGATAITLTTSSSVFCFLVSGLYGADQPAFLKFNLTMTVALLINYLGFIFYFAGCMALNEHRIASGRADLMPWKMAKPGKLPEWTDVAKRLRNFINDTYAPLFVTSLPFKLCGLAVMVVSIVLAVVFMPTINSGMAQTTFLVDSSALYETYDDFDRLGGGHAAQSTTVQVTNLDMASNEALATFQSEFIDPITRRSETLWVACLPSAFHRYRNTTLEQGGSPRPWEEWLQADYLAQLLFGHVVYEGDAKTASTIECTVVYLNDVVSKDASSRIDIMHSFYDITKRANELLPGGASIRLNNFEWAINTSLDDASSYLCWQGIIVAILTVQVVLIFTLPLFRALITTINIFLVVFCVIGFMGYAGFNYNLLTLCVTAMGPGFCVDYTVEVMHFSNLGPAADRMGLKFTKGMKLCGYDVLHGSVTGMLGVACLMMCPGEAPRIFGTVTMVMIFYGGMFALWCLPAVLTLLDDLFQRGDTAASTSSTVSAERSVEKTSAPPSKP